MLASHKGVAPGFDMLRLVLAVMVILWHSVYVSYGRDSAMHDAVAYHPAIQPFLRAILPSFFFLSGFLVAGSALRLKNTTHFLAFRVLRILPALLVEVTLSALVLGAAVTVLAPAEYYTDAEFFAYFLNIVGNVHFYLPGVFENQPSNVVNVNLWTLPYEFYVYAAMAVLMLSRLLYDRKVFTFVFAVATLLMAEMYYSELADSYGNAIFVHPVFLFYAFFLGNIVYIWADHIPVKGWLMALSAFMLYFFNIDDLMVLGFLGACYLTLCLGFVAWPKTGLLGRGDYSYGLYLYGFPIAQAIWYYLPFCREWWSLFPASLALAAVFSVASWHAVEKPFLGLKRYLVFLQKKN